MKIFFMIILIVSMWTSGFFLGISSMGLQVRAWLYNCPVTYLNCKGAKL